jgi:beta-glucosidase
MSQSIQRSIIKQGRAFLPAVMLLVIVNLCFSQEDQPAYKNPDLRVDKRVEDLVSRMTLEEKISQMSHLAPAIERLGIKAYDPVYKNPLDPNQEYNKEMMGLVQEYRPWENQQYWERMCMDGGWWSEALHGVARAGRATAFPQAIGMGSTWNPDLIQEMATVTSTEARIHHNVYGKKLTYWSPTINILRDPRWGRTEESYSEDPYLLSRMAVSFVKGMQGDHSEYLKTVATVKHFVANNSEFNRHDGSSDVSERFLREYYLPAFKAAVTKGDVQSIMGAYNAVNGVPACASERLMTDILRKEWGFDGYVVSDCGAISDIVHDHEYLTDPEKAVAQAVKAGTDLECETCMDENFMYDKYLLNAVKKGYISGGTIDKAVKRLFRTRFLLGEFDPKEEVPWNDIPKSKLECKEHQKLALKVARESMVLLKNENDILPLNKNSIDQVAAIGPNANVTRLGGYSGSPSVRISPVEGLKEALAGEAEVKFAQGCTVTGNERTGWDQEAHEPIYKELDESESIRKAAELAGESDVSILFVGTSLEVADEEADRSDLDLPGNQLKLIKEVYEANPNTIVVLINGIPLGINWVDKNIPGILEAWYPGQAGGTAIADVLFGEYNPGGRLPVTFYKNVDQLPPIADYDITKGRTYWFLEEEPLYRFGHGLSYTTFKYGNLDHPSEINNGENFEVTLEVKNTGDVAGDEVVQLYVSDREASLPVARRKLQAFRRIHLNQGETKTVTFELSPKNLAFVNEQGTWIVEPGSFIISAGGRQPGDREVKPGNYSDMVVGEMEVTGNKFTIE